MQGKEVPLLSSEYDGRPRWLYPLLCYCGKTYYVPKNQLDKRKTCSRVCGGKRSRNRSKYVCGFCFKSFERALSKERNSKSKIYFCSRGCKDSAQRLGGLIDIQPPHYGDAPYNRDFLIRSRGHLCEECGNARWQLHKIPLEVHHVDGNAFNCEDINLKLLCTNCHALTPNYGGRNMGFGRKARIAKGNI